MAAARRFIVVSSYFPPLIGGSSTVMRNLLSAFDPESFLVIAEKPGSFDGQHDSPVPAGVRVVRAGVPSAVTRRIPYGVKISRWLRYAMTPYLEGLISKAAAQVQAERIVAVYPSWPFMIAALAAHRRLGIPLITYYMDVSVDGTKLPWPDRPVVRRYEQKILRAASQRLVLSGAIQEDIEQRFGLHSVVIPHSIEITRTPKVGRWPAQEKKLIVHTGVVEALQIEGLKRIAGVIGDHPELNAKLVLVTPTPRARLHAIGLDLPHVEILKLSDDEVRTVQSAAAVLVAVLPFHGDIEAYQLTAFPTKAVEYMRAGAPILAHAPGESFFAKHVRAHGYALLVDRPEPEALLQALTLLLRDDAARARLTERARTVVEEIYALPGVARRFADACGLDPAILKPGLSQ